jgi:hypothetical protein
MTTSVYIGLKAFNSIRKHFLQIWLWYVSYVRSYWFFKTDIFLLRQLAQWFRWTPPHRVRNIHRTSYRYVQMVFHIFRCLTLSLFYEISQQAYELHCVELQVFLEIFQQIAPRLNRCIYCLLERRIQQEIHVPQLREPQWVKSELNNYTLYGYCTSTAV